MKRERILSAALALVFALAAFAPVSVSADDKKTEEEIIKFTYDKDKVTDTKQPALSFDSTDYKEYIHLTRDAEKGGIAFDQDRDTAYQGVSLKVTADSKGVSGYFNGSGFVNDEDGKPLYPDTPEVEDVINLNFVGIELRAADFGLSTFDGCLFNFAYRLSPEDEDALLGKTVWLFGANDDNVRKSDPLQLTFNNTIDDNVSQYRGNGLISIPEASNATKLIFDIPVQKKMSAAALYLDNIVIQLPGDAGFVANVDGYNENAKVSEVVEEIKITKGKNDTTIADKELVKEKDNTKKRIVILVVVIVTLVIAGAVTAVVFLRKRFY